MPRYKIAPTETVKHDGIVYTEGEIIELTEAQAKALLESKTVLKVGGKKAEAPKPPKKKAPKKAKRGPKAEIPPGAAVKE
jgi:hypothetical protein